MPIVTISRQYASGGGEVAETVARRLGAALVDRQFVDDVAQRLGVPGEVVLEKDERGESLVTRLARSLRLSYPDLAMPPEMTTALFTDYQDVEDLPYAQVIEQVIRESARSGNAVIVGRGGACAGNRVARGVSQLPRLRSAHKSPFFLHWAHPLGRG